MKFLRFAVYPKSLFNIRNFLGEKKGRDLDLYINRKRDREQIDTIDKDKKERKKVSEIGRERKKIRERERKSLNDSVSSQSNFKGQIEKALSILKSFSYIHKYKYFQLFLCCPSTYSFKLFKIKTRLSLT